jgi:hypothetical protein
MYRREARGGFRLLKERVDQEALGAAKTNIGKQSIDMRIDTRDSLPGLPLVLKRVILQF